MVLSSPQEIRSNHVFETKKVFSYLPFPSNLGVRSHSAFVPMKRAAITLSPRFVQLLNCVIYLT